MNTRYLNIFFCAAALSLAACSDKDSPEMPDTPNKPVGGVEVKISTAEIQTKKAQLSFEGNDKMNIYALSYGRVDAPAIVDDVVATYNGSTWAMTPQVYLSDTQKNAFIYAVSPYDIANIDPAKIPVDLSKQVDLMYSGYFVPASQTSPEVKLTMQHALSLLSFNIVPVNYSGAGKLSSLAVDGDIVFTNGTMDASTGKITVSNEKHPFTTAFDRTLEQGGWKNNIPGLWQLPFNTRAGEAVLTAVIDGKEYKVTLPEVEMKTGWQYIFRMVLTNSGLEFDPSKTETISLNVTTDEAQSFQLYGKIEITSDGQSVVTPTLTGDGVFGTVSTPTKNFSYDGDVTVDGLRAGDKVTVESWNSTGFSVSTLDGVTTIDLSAYE